MVVGFELSGLTEKGKTRMGRKLVRDIDPISKMECLAVAGWAQYSGGLTGEPFLTMRRYSSRTQSVHRCLITDSHCNMVIKDAAIAQGFTANHFSTHSSRSGMVTQHTWAREAAASSLAGNGVASSDQALATMGGWVNATRTGAMRVHYDRTTSVYRPINPQFALTRDDVVSMLSIHEQSLLPRHTAYELAALSRFQRTIWG